MLSIAVSITELLTFVTVTIQGRAILSFLSLLYYSLTSVFDYSVHPQELIRDPWHYRDGK